MEKNPTPPAPTNRTEAQQRGTVYLGPGALREHRRAAEASLTSGQRERLDRARKYAREQGIRTAMLRQTIAHEQQRTASTQLCAQRLQALAIMRRVYVGGINFQVDEEKVRQAFLPYGPIKSLTMPYSAQDSRHKGFAFVEFETAEAAYLAVERMNGRPVGGFAVTVGRPSNMPQVLPAVELILEEARSTARVYVANVDRRLNDLDVRSVFESCGPVRSCRLAVDPLSAAGHREYAYVEYEREEDARQAVEIMRDFNLAGRSLLVGRCVTPQDQASVIAPSAFPVASAIAAAAATAKITEMEALGSAAVGREDPVPVAVIIPSLHPQAGAESISASRPARTSPRGLDSPRPEATRPPARPLVLCLRNMVEPEEVDAGLEEEVAEECGNYGRVVAVETKVDPTRGVEMLVRFESPESLVAALAAMDGRLFAGRKVEAVACPEAGKAL